MLGPNVISFSYTDGPKVTVYPGQKISCLLNCCLSHILVVSIDTHNFNNEQYKQLIVQVQMYSSKYYYTATNCSSTAANIIIQQLIVQVQQQILLYSN